MSWEMIQVDPPTEKQIKYIIRHDIRLEDHSLMLQRLRRTLGADVVALISKSIQYGIPIGAYHKQLQDIKETDYDITRV